MILLILLVPFVTAGILKQDEHSQHGHRQAQHHYGNHPSLQRHHTSSHHQPGQSPLDHRGHLQDELRDATGYDQYNPIDQDHYQNEMFESVDKQNCHFVEKIVYKDDCVPYTEKTCSTHQREHCDVVHENNCTAVVDEFEDRECFDVTELVCHLEETVDYEVIEETVTIQRCKSVSDQGCDTVYDMETTTKDDYQCVEVEHHSCYNEEKIVKDRTCIFSVDFECGKLSAYQKTEICEKIPTKKCYDTPRKIRQEVCQPKISKHCEKFKNKYPYPVEKQNCHSEPMKKCKLETHNRPKKAKKYNYVKVCQPVKRQVCDDCGKKKLRPVCRQIERNVCSYRPEEVCENQQREFCFKAEAVMKEKVCVPNKIETIDETLRYV